MEWTFQAPRISPDRHQTVPLRVLTPLHAAMSEGPNSAIQPTPAIITSAGAYLPYVFLGSLVFESFFGLPGLGAYVIEAIGKQGVPVRLTVKR